MLCYHASILITTSGPRMWMSRWPFIAIHRSVTHRSQWIVNIRYINHYYR